jgi:hypothetical protein
LKEPASIFMSGSITRDAGADEPFHGAIDKQSFFVGLFSDIMLR